VSDDIALEKACTAFRSRRKIQKRGERVQEGMDSVTTQESLGSSVDTFKGARNVDCGSSHLKRPLIDLLDDNDGRAKGPIVHSFLEPVIWENGIVPANAMEEKIESRRLMWSHPDLDLSETSRVYSEVGSYLNPKAPPPEAVRRGSGRVYNIALNLC
jgi:hypothetical protein